MASSCSCCGLLRASWISLPYWFPLSVVDLCPLDNCSLLSSSCILCRIWLKEVRRCCRASNCSLSEDSESLQWPSFNTGISGTGSLDADCWICLGLAPRCSRKPGGWLLADSAWADCAEWLEWRALLELLLLSASAFGAWGSILSDEGIIVLPLGTGKVTPAEDVNNWSAWAPALPTSLALSEELILDEIWLSSVSSLVDKIYSSSLLCNSSRFLEEHEVRFRRRRPLSWVSGRVSESLLCDRSGKLWLAGGSFPLADKLCLEAPAEPQRKRNNGQK